MFTLNGCMELNGGVYRPVWVDPCTGEDVVGCMVEVEGKLAPKLENAMGWCDDDVVGCMGVAAGKHRPVLVFDAYDDEADFKFNCCPTCLCFDENQAPQFIKVTFSGLSLCGTQPSCGAGGSPPGNGSYILEFNPGLTFSLGHCAWCYTDGQDPETVVAAGMRDAGGGVVELYIHYTWCGGSSCFTFAEQILTGVKHFIFSSFEVLADGCNHLEDATANDIDISFCPPPDDANHVRGYGGTGTIDLTP